MEITQVFYLSNRAEWRAWLETNHRRESEVWLQTFNKASGKPTLK